MFSSSLIFLSLFALAACYCSETISGLSDDQKNQVVNSHNELRNLVASGQQSGQQPAENMKEMVWDDELANSAQDWANRCVFQHDPNLSSTGQNIYMSSASWKEETNFSKYIQSWYDEVNQYGYNGEFTSQTGHYSQIIWADTNKVGCGYGLSEENSMHNLYFVCNYSPPGNYLGQEAYIKGESNCAKHSMQTSTNYASLCV